jgi:AI-2 transport protein TqsA
MTDRATQQRIQSVCLLILAGSAGSALLYFFRSVMVPFVLSLFFAIGLTPLIDVQVRRLRFPRRLAVVTTLLAGLVLLFAMGLVVSMSVARMADQADTYSRQVRDLLDRAAEALPLARFGIAPDQAMQELLPSTGAVRDALMNATNAIVGIVSQGVMVVVFVCFLLFGGGRAVTAGGVVAELIRRTRRYILILAMISAATGILTWLTLTILGVPLALVFGLLAFVLNFIPSVGSIVATLLPLPVLIVSPEISTTETVLAIAILSLIQFVLGNVLQPRMMGKSFDLHPVTVLAALIFWGVLWGIPGMFLGTPITAIVKMLLDRSDLTRPAGRLLAGRLDPDGDAEK